MYLVVYYILCALNGVMLSKFTDLSLGDWQTWVWIGVPVITYLAGIEAGRRSK